MNRSTQPTSATGAIGTSRARKTRAIVLASAVGLLVAVAVAADIKAPATEGAQTPGRGGPAVIGPGGPGGQGGRWRGMGPMVPPPTQQELQETVNFFREHAPNRFALYDQLDDGQPRRRVLRVMINRFRQVQRFKDSDPDLYGLAVKQFELQDEAFGILRNASSNGSPDAETLGKLREKVKSLAQLGMQEREKRVERLERMLQEEKTRLESDKADPDALVDRQMRQIRNEAEDVKRHFDQLQDFQRGREDRGNSNAPTTAPSGESR